VRGSSKLVDFVFVRRELRCALEGFHIEGAKSEYFKAFSSSFTLSLCPQIYVLLEGKE
jgi:hypothetical protein